MRGTIFTRSDQMRGLLQFRDHPYLFAERELPECIIMCGGCDHWRGTGSRYYAASRLMMVKAGWRNKAKYGWVCPSCIERHTRWARYNAQRTAMLRKTLDAIEALTT